MSGFVRVLSSRQGQRGGCSLDRERGLGLMEQLFWVSTGIPRTRSLTARPGREMRDARGRGVRAKRSNDGDEFAMADTNPVDRDPSRLAGRHENIVDDAWS